MPFKSLFLLTSLGQASFISSHIAASSIGVLGTVASFSILEGNGCPAGTYQTQPFESRRSLNTYADFDSFVYSSATSPGPLVYILSVDFEFIIPEDGTGVFIGNSAFVNIKYEEGYDAGETNFYMTHDMPAQAGSDGIAVCLSLEVVSCASTNVA